MTETHNKASSLNVGIICSRGIGDALVQMVIANNLAEMGAQVTFYSDVATQFRPLVNAFALASLPSNGQFLETVERHQVTLYDSSAPIIQGLASKEENWLKSNAVCFRMSHSQPQHRGVEINNLIKRLGTENEHLAPFFARFNACLRVRRRSWHRPPVVEQLTRFLKDQVGFVSVTSHNGINTLDRKANRQKIVIHPTSSRTQKNWPTDKYIRLATLLKEQDYEPIFTVSPAEREQWLEHTQGNFQVPYFQNLSVLAEFYQDARLFIGNDSGNAHLASYVGVPTVQIFKRYRRNPAWRAGWSDSRVIIAKIPYCFYSNDWAKGISVVRVLTAVRDQLALDQLNRTDYAN